MKKISRRKVLKALGPALAAPMISRYAHAAEVTWRIGHVAPVDTPLHLRLVEAADAISKRSGGKMELSVIGEGKLGVQSGLLAQVRNGGLDMTVATCTQLEPNVSVCSIPSIGFMFGDYANVWPVMDGELGQLIRSQIRVQLNMEIMDNIWDFGFRHITTGTRPIQTAEDLSGMKIRTQIDANQMEMFRALAAVPVVITLPYLRTALEHHQVDGQEGMLPVVQFARLNEVQSFCAMTHHAWDGLWVCVNAKSWSRLPERLQRIVSIALNGAAQRQREDNARMVDSLRAALQAGGMKFADVDPAGFRALLRRQGYYARTRTRLGDQTWNLIQKSTGLLT